MPRRHITGGAGRGKTSKTARHEADCCRRDEFAESIQPANKNPEVSGKKPACLGDAHTWLRPRHKRTRATFFHPDLLVSICSGWIVKSGGNEIESNLLSAPELHRIVPVVRLARGLVVMLGWCGYSARGRHTADRDFHPAPKVDVFSCQDYNAEGEEASIVQTYRNTVRFELAAVLRAQLRVEFARCAFDVQFFHHASRHVNNPFGNVGHPVADAFEVVGHP